MSTTGLRNIGPRSAAWLRQVGVHDAADLAGLGAVAAFTRIRRAGFKPSLNLLYSLEGALLDCHWQQVPIDRRQQLVQEYERAAAGLPVRDAHARARAFPSAVHHEDRPDTDAGPDADGRSDDHDDHADTGRHGLDDDAR